MRLLILVEDYPSNNSAAMAFVHTRCVEYLECDKTIEPYVLSFRAKNDYTIDGISVITSSSFEKMKDKCQFDILISHAPNVKHHMRFIKRNEKLFSDIVFFFHGHEALKIIKYYPVPYGYMPRRTVIKSFMQSMYDQVKLSVLKRTILHLRKNEKVFLVFVSAWMKEQFFMNTKIKKNLLDEATNIIYNPIHISFERASYSIATPKKHDFVTIRANWDGSKYGIDILCKLAANHPDLSFLLYGKGNYFQHNHKPDNVQLREAHLTPDEMISVLNQCKCALMPSRLDAQGVMACEMASFGIPLITSDIPVFHEIFKGFENVQFISNDDPGTNLNAMLENRTHLKQRNHTFYAEQTIQKELDLYRRIVKERSDKRD